MKLPYICFSALVIASPSHAMDKDLREETPTKSGAAKPQLIDHLIKTSEAHRSDFNIPLAEMMEETLDKILTREEDAQFAAKFQDAELRESPQILLTNPTKNNSRTPVVFSGNRLSHHYPILTLDKILTRQKGTQFAAKLQDAELRESPQILPTNPTKNNSRTPVVFSGNRLSHHYSILSLKDFFRHLDTLSLINLSRTNKTWSTQCSNEIAFRKRLYQDFCNRRPIDEENSNRNSSVGKTQKEKAKKGKLLPRDLYDYLILTDKTDLEIMQLAFDGNAAKKKKDYVKARPLLQEAALYRYWPAMRDLGEIYEAKKKPSRAYSWYILSFQYYWIKTFKPSKDIKNQLLSLCQANQKKLASQLNHLDNLDDTGDFFTLYPKSSQEKMNQHLKRLCKKYSKGSHEPYLNYSNSSDEPYLGCTDLTRKTHLFNSILLESLTDLTLMGKLGDEQYHKWSRHDSGLARLPYLLAGLSYQKSGLPDSLYSLGELYRRGKLYEIYKYERVYEIYKYERAAYYYEKSNLPTGLYKLGKLYEKGKLGEPWSGKLYEKEQLGEVNTPWDKPRGINVPASKLEEFFKDGKIPASKAKKLLNDGKIRAVEAKKNLFDNSKIISFDNNFTFSSLHDLANHNNYLSLGEKPDSDIFFGDKFTYPSLFPAAVAQAREELPDLENHVYHLFFGEETDSLGEETDSLGEETDSDFRSSSNMRSASSIGPDGWFFYAGINRCEEAAYYYEKSGLPKGYFYLANLYYWGKLCQNNKYEKAAYYYEKSHTPDGLYCIGVLYEDGNLGPEPDYQKAIEYYEKAGNSKAFESLGLLYQCGKISGTPDYHKAAQYYRKAGSSWAFLTLGQLYAQGFLSKNQEPNYQNAAAYYELSQSPQALLNLAQFHEYGLLEGSPDYLQALNYFESSNHPYKDLMIMNMCHNKEACRQFAVDQEFLIWQQKLALEKSCKHLDDDSAEKSFILGWLAFEDRKWDDAFIHFSHAFRQGEERAKIFIEMLKKKSEKLERKSQEPTSQSELTVSIPGKKLALFTKEKINNKDKDNESHKQYESKAAKKKEHTKKHINLLSNKIIIPKNTKKNLCPYVVLYEDSEKIFY